MDYLAIGMHLFCHHSFQCCLIRQTVFLMFMLFRNPSPSQSKCIRCSNALIKWCLLSFPPFLVRFRFCLHVYFLPTICVYPDTVFNVSNFIRIDNNNNNTKWWASHLLIVIIIRITLHSITHYSSLTAFNVLKSHSNIGDTVVKLRHYYCFVHQIL